MIYVAMFPPFPAPLYDGITQPSSVFGESITEATLNRWFVPDGAFITADAPLFVLFHGLEGDRTSHSSVAFASAARKASAPSLSSSTSGALPARPVANVDEMAFEIEQAQLEHGEQADGTRADDENGLDVGALRHCRSPSSSR